MLNALSLSEMSKIDNSIEVSLTTKMDFQESHFRLLIVIVIALNSRHLDHSFIELLRFVLCYYCSHSSLKTEVILDGLRQLETS